MSKKFNLTSLWQHCLPQHWLSRAVGLLAKCPWRIVKNPFIRWFCRHYQVDLSICPRQNYKQYKNFNDFFTRHLNNDARPLAKNRFICPVDGTISALGNLFHGQLLQAKGKYYDIAKLTADTKLATLFADGQFATLYLAPSNYHRVHMPMNGKLMWMTYIPGKLFSVNQQTAESIPDLFCRNERLYCHFETAYGPLGIVLVGAMIVASIVTTWAGKVTSPNKQAKTTHYDGSVVLKQGDELGWFELGSTVILLLPKGAPKLCETLGSGQNIVLGQAFASVTEDEAISAPV